MYTISKKKYFPEYALQLLLFQGIFLCTMVYKYTPHTQANNSDQTNFHSVLFIQNITHNNEYIT